METRYSNSHLFIYGMRDASTFMTKGDAPVVTHVSLLSQKQTCLRY
jgi:hypothetical protein